jgi:tetratricopeptide (TPR) repeat protein
MINLLRKRDRTLPPKAIATQAMLKPRLLSVFFLTVLVICLGWGKVSAQVSDSLIQQGLERYRNGDYQGAIAIWNDSLNKFSNAADRVMPLKSLARVYSQIGQFEESIATLNSLIADYQKKQRSRSTGKNADGTGTSLQ